MKQQIQLCEYEKRIYASVFFVGRGAVHPRGDSLGRQETEERRYKLPRAAISARRLDSGRLHPHEPQFRGDKRGHRSHAEREVQDV